MGSQSADGQERIVMGDGGVDVKMDGLPFDRFFNDFPDFDYPSMRQAIELEQVVSVMFCGPKKLYDCRSARIETAEVRVSELLSTEEAEALLKLLAADYQAKNENFERRGSSPNSKANIPAPSGMKPVSLTVRLPDTEREYLENLEVRSRTVADFLLKHWDEFKRFSARD